MMATTRLSRCFRGIHDNLISDQEVGETLRLGAQLIQEGGDHFDIYSDDKNLLLLQDRLPTLLSTIKRLLRDTYLIGRETTKLKPVAFRVNAVGPFDGKGVALHGSHSQSSNYLLRILNRTVR